MKAFAQWCWKSTRFSSQNCCLRKSALVTGIKLLRPHSCSLRLQWRPLKIINFTATVWNQNMVTRYNWKQAIWVKIVPLCTWESDEAIKRQIRMQSTYCADRHNMHYVEDASSTRCNVSTVFPILVGITLFNHRCLYNGCDICLCHANYERLV